MPIELLTINEKKYCVNYKTNKIKGDEETKKFKSKNETILKNRDFYYFVEEIQEAVISPIEESIDKE